MIFVLVRFLRLYAVGSTLVKRSHELICDAENDTQAIPVRANTNRT
jgi:hypothetical protein